MTPLRTHTKPRTYAIRESSGSWLVEATWWDFDTRGEDVDRYELVGDYPTEDEARRVVAELEKRNG